LDIAEWRRNLGVGLGGGKRSKKGEGVVFQMPSEKRFKTHVGGNFRKGLSWNKRRKEVGNCWGFQSQKGPIFEFFMDRKGYMKDRI